MKLLTLSQARFLRLTPWSTVTVFTGILLGVASVVAVHLISVRVAQSLAQVTPAYLDELTFLLEKPAISMDDYFELRRSWRAATVAGSVDTAQLRSIQVLAPVLEGRLEIAGKPVTVVGLDGFSGLGAALPLAVLPPRGLIASAALGYAEGARLRLHDGPDALEYEVAGIAEQLNEALLLTDIGTAQEILGLPASSLSRVGVRVDHPWFELGRVLGELLPGFAAGFSPYDWQLAGWEVRPVDSELPSRSFAESVLFNLGALGSLALIVAWLLVFQVAVIWLRRRRRTMEILHLQGVTHAELAGGFLLSMLALGTLATLSGIVAGWLLALLLGELATLGLAVDAGRLSVDRWLLVKALVSGVGVSLVGGYLAYRQEWRTQSARRWPGAAVLALLIGAGAAGIWLVEALWGGFVAIIAISVSAIIAVHPLLRGLRSRAVTLRNAGVSGAGAEPSAGDGRGRKISLLARLGLRELVWYPQDLAIAVGALALAVATSLAIGLMVDSFRKDFAGMLEQRLAHDLFIRGGDRDLADVVELLAARNDVAEVAAYGSTRARVRGYVIELGYTAASDEEAQRYSWARALRVGEALASERLCRELGVAPGDTIAVAVEGTQTRVRIVASFPGFGDVAPRLLVSTDTARVAGVTARFTRLSVNTSADEALLAYLTRLRPDLEVRLAAPLRAFALRVFDQTFAITRALTLVALLVAGIGLYNALLALKLNQQPTISLLRAMGAREAELRWVELWRAVGVGAAVLGLAVPIGLSMGWILCEVVNPRAFGWSLDLQITASAVLPPLLLGSAVIALVGVLPAPAETLVDAQ